MCAANVVPSMLTPKLKEKSSSKLEEPKLIGEGDRIKMECLDEEQQAKLMTKLDLSGIENWSEKDQSLVKQLFKDFG